MLIEKLELTNFRSYEELDICFDDGINFLTGNNGEGKTNVLEAISLLSLGKSFVTSQENNCIKYDNEFAVIKSRVSAKRIKEVEIILSLKGKIVLMNGKKIKKMSEMADNLLIVTFSPKDVRLFKDLPNERRKIINTSLAMLSKTYISLLKQYNELMKRRNDLLKQDVDCVYLEVLDKQIALASYSIVKTRVNFIKRLNQKIKDIYLSLGVDSELVELKYKTIIPYEENKEDYIFRLQNLLKNNYEQDIKRKTTTKGIHHDDLVLEIGKKDISVVGSQGQNRIAVLVLKLALAKLLNELSGENPILLLDDAMSELDTHFQKKLENLLIDMGQVFITGNEVPKVMTKYREYVVSNREIRRI